MLDKIPYFTGENGVMSSSGVKCYARLDECPKGHEMERCDYKGESGRYCKQCGELTYQPDRNRFGDQCKMRQTCNKYKMKYKVYGDKTRDAECECEPGYHFENEDQRACVPNKLCGKGYGQGNFEDGRLTGICEKCIDKNMWSDTQDTFSKCKPLTNCEKQGKCTIVESNGTFDNRCGPGGQDVSKCTPNSTIEPPSSPSTGVVLGAVFGSLAVVLLILVITVCYLRRRREARKSKIRKEQLEEMLPEIIKRSRKDEKYCNKVLDFLQKEIEDRINNQIWDLPRELFRNHIQPARYEQLVEKYRDKQHKFAINGYMHDWRGWKGESPNAVEELVNCLKHDNVKRMDIVLEVVNKMREDFPEVVEGYDSSNRRSKPGSSNFCSVLCPGCCADDVIDSYECKEETSSKLLPDPPNGEKDTNLVPPNTSDITRHPPPGDGGAMTPEVAGAVYRSAPTPSAPVLDGDESYPHVEVKGQHFYDRSDSTPVQASN